MALVGYYLNHEGKAFTVYLELEDYPSIDAALESLKEACTQQLGLRAEARAEHDHLKALAAQAGAWLSKGVSE